MSKQGTEDQVFDSVAELFSVLSTPIRLKIISAVIRNANFCIRVPNFARPGLPTFANVSDRKRKGKATTLPENDS